ncbi:hypothetical protein Poly30_42610 [Planctomycetes bacterium Poly30]|uniref:Uncharacterized protein n=1 Tax=Saltatorellus ferox TaxID=2528018 RepID=A0A518EX98_9BACT|nr:hypothetical protein Poly30_42610 [Planctomycetes bacterium Poly30]
MKSSTQARTAARTDAASGGTASGVPASDQAALSRPVPTGWRPEAGWRDLLSGRQPDVILARLLDGDPLRLRGLVARAIRGGSFFLDADRVHLRALARIAHDVTIDGPPADGSWVQGHVDGALGDVLRAERRAIVADGERANLDSGSDPELEALHAFAAPLGFEGADLRVACDAFNRRAAGERRAFFALFVERLGLEEAARACGLSGVDLARSARTALNATLDAAVKSAGRRAEALQAETSSTLSSVSPREER